MRVSTTLNLTLLTLSFCITGSNGSLRSLVSTAWTKFWSISCDYTTLIHRSKRSPDVPNFQSVDDVFEYLYPSAHIQVHDLVQHNEGSGGRSDAPAFTKRTFATWVDHLIEIWETECRSRGRSNGADDLPSDAEDDTDDPVPEATDTGNASLSTALSLDKTARQPGPPGFADFFPTALPSLFPTLLPTLIPTLPVPTPGPLATKTKDTFFAAYGGDIEYFIPLVSFGIPFDGEITVLGFHGFKGLFPYR